MDEDLLTIVEFKTLYEAVTCRERQMMEVYPLWKKLQSLNLFTGHVL
jgi:hypothetical protein